MKIKINLKNRSRKHSAITENISCKLLTNELFQNKADFFLYAPWHWTRRKPEELLNQRFSDTGPTGTQDSGLKAKKTSEGDPQGPHRVPQGVQTLEQGEGSKQGLGVQAEILEEWMLLDILYHNGKYRTRKLHRRQTDRQTGTERWRELWRLQGGPLSKDIWALCGQELPGLSKSHWKRASWEIAGVTQTKKNLCSQQPEWNQKP